MLYPSKSSPASLTTHSLRSKSPDLDHLADHKNHSDTASPSGTAVNTDPLTRRERRALAARELRRCFTQASPIFQAIASESAQAHIQSVAQLSAQGISGIALTPHRTERIQPCVRDPRHAQKSPCHSSFVWAATSQPTLRRHPDSRVLRLPDASNCTIFHDLPTASETTASSALLEHLGSVHTRRGRRAASSCDKLLVGLW